MSEILRCEGCGDVTTELHETDDMVNLCCKCYILCLNESYTALRTAADRLEKTLALFLEDPRFNVSVGGNPIAVYKMYNEARAALAAYRALGVEKENNNGTSL